MAKKTKGSRVKDEKKRLEGNYASLSEAKKVNAKRLIERAAFMCVELEDLEEDIAKNGWTEKFSQGDQEPYDRNRPQGQTYIALNDKYRKLMDKLDSMLPKEEPKTRENDDGFDDFVSGRDEV